MEQSRAAAERGRARAARIGVPLNVAMIVGGVWLIYEGAGWVAALGSLIMLWGWISDTTRGLGAMIEVVAEATDDGINARTLAQSKADKTIKKLERRIDDLERRLVDLKERSRSGA
jgi:hypothetical protein